MYSCYNAATEERWDCDDSSIDNWDADLWTDGKECFIREKTSSTSRTDEKIPKKAFDILVRQHKWTERIDLTLECQSGKVVIEYKTISEKISKSIYLEDFLAFLRASP